MDFVRVEYVFKDVLPPQKGRKKAGGGPREVSFGVRPSSRPQSAGVGGNSGKSSKSNMSNSDKQPSPAIKMQAPLVPEVEEVTYHGRQTAPVLPLPLRPKSASALRRDAPIRKEYAAWNFTSKELDRESMQIEQDLGISAYRCRHPELYADSDHVDPSPIYRRDKATKVACRDRVVPQTSGNVMNNPFPQYPFLHEDKTGIHPSRWSVMTATEDDPDRCKPVLNCADKSQGSFHRSFHTISRGGTRLSQTSLNTSAVVSRFKDSYLTDPSS